MPLIYRCSRCGAPIRIIRAARDIDSLGLPSPSEVAATIPRCPRCGAHLHGGLPKSIDVVVVLNAEKS